ncbi:MAG: hypothetical protein A2Y34_14625 [Spirochaetes bacterium GWC1_27_15]|nr:MAG: hypothetical protein A2Z98_11795 [Spirochaetes bacterium GWB1_27_13]OHD27894.1 MAG: hypothetical protein A2Y34_14625 [Spirochaetes bacterium GWC1_27_15]
MDYRLENISENEFEELVNSICQKILGIGIISFRKGKDGGRDGKFEGIAENYPSSKLPWKGKFIIQSKHTDNPIASCSDNNFQNMIKKDEIPKLKVLKANNEVDNYLLFTNRRFNADIGINLEKEIKNTVCIENVVIIGKETIHQYLNLHKNIVSAFNLNKYFLPFDFTDTDLKELVLEFHNQITKNQSDIRNKIKKIKDDCNYIEKELKNEKNKLGRDYFEYIKTNSLEYFSKIDIFLKDTINNELTEVYLNLTNELNNMILVKRDEFAQFEEIFVYIYQYVYNKNPQLKNKRRFINIFLHYMYFNCDIGVK